MKKQIFHDAAAGVLIGLILSILFSLMYAPNTYAPLSPESLIGQAMVQHQVHGALVLLYCMVIWSAIGVALIAVLARIIWKEPLTPRMILGLMLIMAGVVLVELG